MKKQFCLLLATGIFLPVFADPVLKVGTFQSKGASLEQPSLVEGDKRVGLREVYGSRFAGQDFKIGVYAGKEEVCRIYFLGSFRGSWGVPVKTIPGKEKIAIDRTKNTISYCKEYQLPDKRIAEFRFTLAPEGPGRVRLSWDPGIPEKDLASIPNFTLKPVVELPPRYREGGFQLVEAEKIHFNDLESLKQRRGAEFPAYLGKVSRLRFRAGDPAKRVEITLPLCWGSVMERLAGGKVPVGTVQRNWAISNDRNILIDFGTGADSKEGSGK